MIVPMFPLQSALLPGESLPLRIFEPRYARLVQDCLGAAEPEFGVVLISRGSEVGGDDVRNDVGALARIVHHVDLGDGQYELLAQVGDRLRVRSWLPDDPYPRAQVTRWPDEPGLGPDEPGLGPDEPGLGPDELVLGPDELVLGPDELVLGPDELVLGPDDDRIGQVVDAILALYQRIARARGGQLRPDFLAVDPGTAADPGRHLYALAARVPMGQADRYAVLAAPTLVARVDVLLDAIATVTAMVEFQLSAD